MKIQSFFNIALWMVNPFPVTEVTISPIIMQRLCNRRQVSASYSLWSLPAQRLPWTFYLTCFPLTPPSLSQMQHFCLLWCTADGSLSLLWCLCSWLPDFIETHPVAVENTLTYLMPRRSHWNWPLTDTSKNVTGVGYASLSWVCFFIVKECWKEQRWALAVALSGGTELGGSSVCHSTGCGNITIMIKVSPLTLRAQTLFLTTLF